VIPADKFRGCFSILGDLYWADTGGYREKDMDIMWLAGKPIGLNYCLDVGRRAS
jgi:hypothetical protein